MTSTEPVVELLGDSAPMVTLREQVRRLLRRQRDAGRLPPILIQGETGTGKGLLARLIHRGSSRASAPFVDINCAAIPETLIEAELFGFERGAFTDARHAKPGLFQAAHRGTLFMDEVGLLPETVQGKLLKAIEERAVRRLGSVESEPTDIWIVAATSEDLASVARARRFRVDLYHRLAALTLTLPPLRARGDDIVLLAEHFLRRACRDYRLPRKTLTADARQALLDYPWPGNVRELANVMERVALLSDDQRVAAALLRLPSGAPATSVDAQASLREAVGDVERSRLVEALAEAGGNVSQAAARLGIPRSSLRYRLEKHGLQPRASVAAGAETWHGADADPTRVPTGTGRRPIDWQSRHVAFLYVIAASEDDRESPSRAFQLGVEILDKVDSFGGRIEEQGPTGFIAVFGLDPMEDACVRAAHAALAVQNAVHHAGTRRLNVACMLHAGHALVGDTSAGVVLDLQDRHRARVTLEALAGEARPGTIVVSETAAPLLERRFQLESPPDRRVGATRTYRVVARESTGYGLAGRPLSPLVGRSRELAMLEDVFARVSAGHGQIVAFVGAPGVGKSRITYEVARAARERGWLTLEGHAASYGRATPYFPVIDLLRRYFRVDDADAPGAVPEKIHRRLATLSDTRLTTITGALLAVLGRPVEDDEWRLLDPSARRDRILDGLKRLVLRESQVQPLIVLFEDLHWVDAETQSFLDRLVASMPAARVLLLVNYRPEYRHPWGSKSYYHQLQIDPLPPESSAVLLDALLGTDASLIAVKNLVIERTEGNPFFIEESIRSLVEMGVLIGEHQAYRVARPVHDVHVPETAEAMIAARIDRLPAEDKQALQVASVVGKDVPWALLRAVADLTDEDLRQRLDRLQAGEFLYETAMAPDLAYSFTHALTHEVAYGGLARPRRREIHSRIVGAIETLHRDRLGEQVEQLAHHALRADLREKAIQYLRQAGLKAAAQSAPQDARRRFEQALDLLDALPESQGTLEQAFEIRLELRPVMQQLGEGVRMLQRLREAEAIAERLNDERRRGLVCALATNDHSRLGELDEALVTGARALGIAERLGDLRLRILTTSFLGQTHYYRGEYEPAVELSTANIAALPADWTYEYFGTITPPAVYDRACLVRSLAELGRFAEAVPHEAEAIRIAESTRHALTIVVAHWAASTLRLLKGEWAEARRVIERELDVVRAGNVVFLLPFVLASYAWALAQLGERDEASSRFEETDQLLNQVVAQRGWAAQALGRACLRLGRLDDARRLAVGALESLPLQRGFAAHALHLLGDIDSHPDRFDAAASEARYHEALALAEPRGMRPLVAHCLLGLGKLYRRTGKRGPAQEHLTTATTMYREMGMTYWLEKAQCQLE